MRSAVDLYARAGCSGSKVPVWTTNAQYHAESPERGVGPGVRLRHMNDPQHPPNRRCDFATTINTVATGSAGVMMLPSLLMLI
jgi:hypothetical protein